MSLKLRDLISSVRACKTAADERALIAKESAEIRTSFKSKDDEGLRHRNVAKLLYIHMLGYSTAFGQMEAMKLVASPRFAEKRIGYLALMLLLDESQEILMLITNSLQSDLHNKNAYIAGLALTAIGNVASIDIAHALYADVADMLSNSNPYIRKKAALCAIRIIHKVPDIVEQYIKPAMYLLGDKSHSVQLTGITLMTTILQYSPSSITLYRALIPRLCAMLRSHWSQSYPDEYDVAGINDPFLQVAIIRFLRLLSSTSHTHILTKEVVHSGPLDDTISLKIDDVLGAVSAHIDPNTIPGASIHYDAIITILSRSNDPALRVNAITQLGRFLQARDNNIRYISLNTLYQVAQQQQRQLLSLKIDDNNNNTNNTTIKSQAMTSLDAIQRHRNIVVAYLKDPDPSIRRRALSLIYLLVTPRNVRPLIHELLLYLSQKTPAEVAASLHATTTGQDTGPSFVFGFNGIQAGLPGVPNAAIGHTASVRPSSQFDTDNPALPGDRFGDLGTLSPLDEFKLDLTSKIYYIIKQYSPDILWQSSVFIQLLSTNNDYISDNISSDMISLLSLPHIPQPIYNNTLINAAATSPPHTDNNTTTSSQQITNNNQHNVTKQELDIYMIYELYYNMSSNRESLSQAYLSQAFFYALGKHPLVLFQQSAAQQATRLAQLAYDDISPQLASSSSSDKDGSNNTSSSTSSSSIHHHQPITLQTLVTLITNIFTHSGTLQMVKLGGLTSITRLISAIQHANIQQQQPLYPTSSLDSLLLLYKRFIGHHNLEVQQRALEYNTLILQSPALSMAVLQPVAPYIRSNDTQSLAVDITASNISLTDAISSSSQQMQAMETGPASLLDIIPDPVASDDITPAKSTNILDDLLADTSTQQQPQQQQQQSVSSSNDLFATLGAMSTPTHQNQSSSTDLLSSMLGTQTAQPQQASSSSSLDDLMRSTSLNDSSSQQPQSPTNFLDILSPSPAVVNQPASQPSTPSSSDRVLFNENGLKITAQIIRNPSSTPNTESITLLCTHSTLRDQITNLDFRIAAKPYINKTIHPPSHRTITPSQPSTQRIDLVNTTFDTAHPTVVRYMTKYSQSDGTSIETQPSTLQLSL